MEANPDDITKERLLIWQRFGINRLSIGIQSFNNDYLTYMNRIHNSKMALNSVLDAQNTGISNISIDLIYGINPMNRKVSKRKTKSPPREYSINELHENWLIDLETAFMLKVPHISSYCLTIEEKTVFGSWLKNNEIKEPDDDFSSTQFKVLQNQMKKNGFEQYEISNFAANKEYAIHNTAYWQGDEYLGVGPSAHSFNGHSRQFTIANNNAYLSAIERNEVPHTIEILSPENRFNELLMTGIRTIWGVNISQLKQIGIGLPTSFESTLAGFEKEGKLKIVDKKIILTDFGKFFADGIAASLFF